MKVKLTNKAVRLSGFICIFDSKGKVVVRYSYNAWGSCKVFDAQGNDITYKENDETRAVYKNELGNLNPFRYRGYYYDVETGLYFLKTRYYDPETGRFINADSIAFLSARFINGTNLYAYCGNNPIMYIDKNGTNFKDWLDRTKRKVKMGLKKLGNDIKKDWDDFCDNIGDRLEEIPIKIGDTVKAFIENASLSIGVGEGIGIDITIFGLFNLTAIYKGDFFSLGLDKTGLRIGGAFERGIGITVLKYFSYMLGDDIFVPYFSDDIDASRKGLDFSVGFGGYFIFGASVSIGVDTGEFLKEFKEIWGII